MSRASPPEEDLLDMLSETAHVREGDRDELTEDEDNESLATQEDAAMAQEKQDQDEVAVVEEQLTQEDPTVATCDKVPVSARPLPGWMVPKREVARAKEADATARRRLKGESRATASLEWVATIRELADRPPVEGRVVVFDTETTGLDPTRDSIVEIGAVEVVDGRRTGSLFQSYARPPVVAGVDSLATMDPRAVAAHDLTAEMLADAPPLSYVMASFLDFVGSSPLVAHNAAFDCRFLSRAADLCGLSSSLPRSCHCTGRLFRSLRPNQPWSLADLAAHFRVSKTFHRTTHGALIDAEVLAACLPALCSMTQWHDTL